MASLPRVFVLSMPKAGTYLLAELLAVAGLSPTQLHLNDDSYDNYARLSLEEGRAHPERARHQAAPAEVVAGIGAGEFAVGHLRHTQALESALESFRLVFLRRDPRTALVSYVRFLVDSGRAEARAVPWRLHPSPTRRLEHFLAHEGEAHLARFRALLPWARHPAALQLRFEDLAQPRSPVAHGEVTRLFDWMGVEPVEPVAALLERAHGTPTITRSSARSTDDGWWSDVARAWWHAHGGDALARDYGYAAG